ncbi:unnamed protein product [Rotaria sp. Silwood1]|nr:unnamed protein product [Rotaria sp. Silwood1]
MDAIKKTIPRKVVHSKGGKVCLSGGSMETWQASIETKPVIVRRAIENITFFIQSDKIPELSEIALARVREKINEAIETYIQMNVHNGCMNRTSPSFNWVANVDDDSCAPPEQNSQFGGFIRTCTEDKRLKQPSNGILQIGNRYVYGGSFTSVRVNPVTGTKNCPDELFSAVHVTDDLVVCLADQVTNTDDLPHYGGIYSCDQGNIAGGLNEKECSRGYSAYVMGVIEANCLLYICLKFEKFLELRQLPSVVLPPFFSISIKNQTNQVINSTETKDFYAFTSTSVAPKGYNTVLGLSITGVCIGVLIIIVLIVLRVRNMFNQRTTYSEL